MTARRLVALAAVALAGLRLLTSTEVPQPSSLTWSGLERWYDAGGGSIAVILLVRTAGLLLAGWLGLSCGLQLAARAVDVRAVSAIADRLSPRFLRGLATGATSLSLVAGIASPSVAAPGEDPPGTALMVPLDPPAGPATTAAGPPSDPPTTTTITAGAPAEPPSPAPVPPPPRVAPAPASPPPVPSDDEVVVEPGDSFWSIAVEERADRDLLDYWLALIERNRERLVDPGNPDLLLPGQVLRLP